MFNGIEINLVMHFYERIMNMICYIDKNKDTFYLKNFFEVEKILFEIKIKNYNLK